ncbi:MAG: Hsp70 family protein, partial [Deltaproteobacteria bacterium]|nr:Hsp70 family protein [Deltaproteobacteria bacterium]
THHTVETVAAGSDASALAVPIVQGEYDDAHLCQLVGKLEIGGARVKRNLPGGSPVEVTLVVDRGGKLSANARVKLAGDQVESFEGVAQLIMPEATVESLDSSLEVAQKRLNDAQSQAFADGDGGAIGALGKLQTELHTAEGLKDSLAGGDTDAGQRAARILLDIDAQLSEIDAERRWPEILEDAEDTYSWALSWVSEYGRDAELRLCERTGQSLEHALDRRSVADVNRHLRTLRRLGSTCFRRDPESWAMSFEHCVSRIEETSDLPKAKQLESRGRKALDKGDTGELRSVVKQMWELIPADPATRRMSYESGVR